MTDLVRLPHLNDPERPARVADAYDRRMGAIYVTDLDAWAWLVEHLDSWLTNATPATTQDYAAFMADRYGPGARPTLTEVCWRLGAMSYRMRVLASEKLS